MLVGIRVSLEDFLLEVQDLFGYSEDDSELDEFISCWDCLDNWDFSKIASKACNIEIERMRGHYDAESEDDPDPDTLNENYEYAFYELENELRPYRQKNKSSYDIHMHQLQDFTYGLVSYLSEFIDELMLGYFEIILIDKRGTRMNVEVTGI